MQKPNIFNNKAFQVSASALTGAVVGAISGYFVGKRNGDVFVVPAEVMNETDEYQPEGRRSYKIGPESVDMDAPILYVPRPVVDPKIQQIMDAAKNDPDVQRMVLESLGNEDKVDRLLEVDVEPIDEDDELDEDVHVFLVEDPDWDHEAELSTRTEDAPYIIHEEEYMANDMGFRQETVTYYVGDDIMSDVRDTPLYNHNHLMGELKFGHGARGADVVYIRNENLRMEWEVIRHSGYYAVEVKGLQLDAKLEDELQHSHSVPKFKRD